MGLEGAWDPGAKVWSLTTWELGPQPPQKYGAPGTLLPHSAGRLRLTAPPCLLEKVGQKSAGSADDPYRLPGVR
jgi:hypothetical protein